ncbi:MAG TPA: hypothetical protein VJU17_01520, partial [Gemmatimonadales bacterium]|nr:hypothetical protein [Gemmatimonadales bacterium]
HESLYDAITRWTADAPAHFLRVLLWSGSLGAFGAMLIDRAQWPVALGLLTLAAVGEWGLLEHRLVKAYSRPLEIAEIVVAAIALVAGLVTLLVGMFIFLGPAPHF